MVLVDLRQRNLRKEIQEVRESPQVVLAGSLGRQSVAKLAGRLANGPAFAYATTKSLLTRELDVSLGAAIELEAMTQALLMHSEDFNEFYAAWGEGRRPDWSGR